MPFFRKYWPKNKKGSDRRRMSYIYLFIYIKGTIVSTDIRKEKKNIKLQIIKYVV